MQTAQILSVMQLVSIVMLQLFQASLFWALGRGSRLEAKQVQWIVVLGIATILTVNLYGFSGMVFSIVDSYLKWVI